MQNSLNTAQLQSMGSQRAGLNWAHVHKVWGFPDGSAGKESTCNAGDAGDLGSVPRLGRSPGGGNGNPLQYSCLKISWTEEPGSLQSMGLQKRNNLATKQQYI